MISNFHQYFLLNCQNLINLFSYNKFDIINLHGVRVLSRHTSASDFPSYQGIYLRLSADFAGYKPHEFIRNC